MALAALLDDDVTPDWPAEADKWDLLNIRRMLLRMLQLRRERNVVDTLRKQVAEQYTERVAALDTEYEGIRTQVQDWITRFNGGDKVRLPDVGTAYLQGKGAQPKMVLASQEEAVTEIAAWTQARQDIVYRKVFDPQAYLALHKEAVEKALAGAATDADGHARLNADGTGVIQTTGEVVDLPPGVVLQVAPPVLALRPA